MWDDITGRRYKPSEPVLAEYYKILVRSGDLAAAQEVGALLRATRLEGIMEKRLIDPHMSLALRRSLDAAAKRLTDFTRTYENYITELRPSERDK
jgi:hypothetical protein